MFSEWRLWVVVNVRLCNLCGCLLFTGNCHFDLTDWPFFACTVKHMQRSGPIEVVSKVVARWGPVLVTLDAKGGLSVVIAGYCCKQQESESTWFNSGNLSLKEDGRCHPNCSPFLLLHACCTTAKILGRSFKYVLFSPLLGEDFRFWIFFKWVETTNYRIFYSSTVLVPWIQPPPKEVWKLQIRDSKTFFVEARLIQSTSS